MPEAKDRNKNGANASTGAQGKKGASKSYSIKNVKVPEGPWCTLLEGAAYARVAYAGFTKAAREEQFPVYVAPGTTNGRRVHKGDIDKWLQQNRWEPKEPTD